jgi:hypothetical protein
MIAYPPPSFQGLLAAADRVHWRWGVGHGESLNSGSAGLPFRHSRQGHRLSNMKHVASITLYFRSPSFGSVAAYIRIVG